MTVHIPTSHCRDTTLSEPQKIEVLCSSLQVDHENSGTPPPNMLQPPFCHINFNASFIITITYTVKYAPFNILGTEWRSRQHLILNAGCQRLYLTKWIHNELQEVRAAREMCEVHSLINSVLAQGRDKTWVSSKTITSKNVDILCHCLSR
jgi:hypothetical protein